MYYLQSRYYDPMRARFINADEPMTLAFGGGEICNNLFSYCENNAVTQKDVNGYIAANIIGAAIGAVIGVVGGVFLGSWLADVLKLGGWRRRIFIAAVAALVGAAAGTIGYFIGPYVAKIVTKLGQYIANLIRQGKVALKNMSSNVKTSLRTLFKETCCFVGGTPISTPEGEKPIEKILVGDCVYAANPETGQIGIKKVVRTFKKQTSRLYHVVALDEEIITTAEHPFWVKAKGWIAAYKLQQGDMLCLQNGKTVEVADVFVEELQESMVVYNFEVEDWHTYFVGKMQIFVHNKCNWNYISDSYLKRKGLDAHAIKYEYLGKKANIKLYDLYYDKATGAVSIFLKKTKELVEVTTYFIK